jgi:hypothetical protein
MTKPLPLAERQEGIFFVCNAGCSPLQRLGSFLTFQLKNTLQDATGWSNAFRPFCRGDVDGNSGVKQAFMPAVGLLKKDGFSR